MTARQKLDDSAVQAFLGANPGWAREGDALVKTFALPSYAAGIAFVVEVGFAAEKRDHHPDLFVGWRKVKVGWSTHDAGGITAVDTEMAGVCDGIHRSTER